MEELLKTLKIQNKQIKEAKEIIFKGVFNLEKIYKDYAKELEKEISKLNKK